MGVFAHLEYRFDEGVMRYTDEGEGQPVLFLHGWGCSVDIWAPLKPLLAQKFRIVAVDFPGACPAAQEAPAHWGMAEYAGLIRDFVRDTGLSGCHVLAHSFGGRVVLKMAEQALPFENILLTGAAGIKPPATGKPSMKSRVYGALRNASQSGAMGKIFGEKAQQDMREKLVQHFGSADYKALSPAMRGVFSRIIGEDLSSNLARIDRPTLLIWGESDGDTPLWMGETMEKTIPDAALIKFENAGHYAFLDKSYEFARIAINFFGGEI